VTYHWKGSNESYNFVIKNTFNHNSYAKITIKQNLGHICSLKNMATPLGTLSICSFEHMVVPWGNLSSFSSWTWLFPWEKKVYVNFWGNLNSFSFPRKHDCPLRQLKPWSFRNMVVLKGSIRFFFSPQNHDYSPRQLKFLFLWEYGSFQKNCYWAINLKILLNGNLFSSISFMDEK
jgi:hypothetical protein